ncbi:hypothetical protein HHSLTHF2_09580 [Vreelandella venusta]|uniref:DUF3718 domain-containing protein n=1 Tax=Halomonas hydrothermalis TaxID=115561 RepID=A0A6F8U0K2_9GAMM|nr:hypothetical protein [Halomonas hydrothermalis]BCB07068.1 hypothetical protein HHSLTHF2_09580 [Halomonas hydrothermalis]
MILKYSAALIFGVIASSQVFAQDLQAKKANEDIMVCMYKAAIDLDDGVSGVNSLAPIIADWCKKESDRFYQIMRRGINGPIDERVARQAIREKDLEMASRIILMKRADERKARQQR